MFVCLFELPIHLKPLLSRFVSESARHTSWSRSSPRLALSSTWPPFAPATPFTCLAVWFVAAIPGRSSSFLGRCQVFFRDATNGALPLSSIRVNTRRVSTNQMSRVKQEANGTRGEVFLKKKNPQAEGRDYRFPFILDGNSRLGKSPPPQSIPEGRLLCTAATRDAFDFMIWPCAHALRDRLHKG